MARKRERPRFTISLENRAGQIDCRTADTPEECRAAVLDIAAGVDNYFGGDAIHIIDHDEGEE